MRTELQNPPGPFCETSITTRLIAPVDDVRSTGGRRSERKAVAGAVCRDLAIHACGVGGSAAIREVRPLPSEGAASITILFVTDGLCSLQAPDGVIVSVRFDQVLLVSMDAPTWQFASPNFSAIAVRLDRTSLLDAYRTMFRTSEDPFGSGTLVADGKSIELKALREIVRKMDAHWHHGAEIEANAASLLHDALILQLVACWPFSAKRYRGGVGDDDAPLDMALAFIEANLAERFSTGDLASAAGVGTRTLQLSFRARTGLTPRQYVIARRLDKVHEHLLRVSGPVHQVAQSWGFTHMGDFARRYRQRFGCAPSDTVARHDATAMG